MPDLSANDRGYVRKRESTQLEFKQSFQPGSIRSYARTMAGMANNHGGEIVFGVKDTPRIPIGLQNEKFENFDPRKINQVLLEHFSGDVDWEIKTHSQHGLIFGVIAVSEASEKPVICTRSHSESKLREGGIYFRYRGETREIRFSELRDILTAERDKEKRLWMDHIQTIAQVGPQYVQIVDALRGEMTVGDTQVIIDEALVKKLNVYKWTPTNCLARNYQRI